MADEYHDRVKDLEVDFINSTAIRVRWNHPLKRGIIRYKVCAVSCELGGFCGVFVGFSKFFCDFLGFCGVL